MTDRESLLHCARVYIEESHRRGRTDFAWALLRWAANCRAKLLAAPRQRELRL